MPVAPLLLAQATASELVDACGTDPSSLCRWTLDQTGSVGVATAVDWLAGVPLQILLVLAVAWILNRTIRRAIRRFSDRVAGGLDPETLGRRRRTLHEKTHGVFLSTGEVNVRASARAETIAQVLRSVCTAVIWTFAVIYVLSALGFSLGPLLAGAGVAGVALGFGTQSLVRDFVSGFFLLIEDQFGVGDVVDLGEASGTVEQVTLRVTRLRDQNGTVWYVPNGQVVRVGNKSQQWARAVLDIAVAPSADLEAAAVVIGEAAEAVWSSPEARSDVLEHPEVLGLEYLGPDAATIRVQGKTRPGAQWRVSRLLRVRIAEALADAGIDLPPSNYVRPGSTAR